MSALIVSVALVFALACAVLFVVDVFVALIELIARGARHDD